MRPTELVHAAYRAFADGDLDAMTAITAPDVVISQDPALPWGGRFVGPEGMADFFSRLMGAIESEVTPEALFAAGSRVVQYGRTRGTVRGTGVAFDIPECHVFDIRGDTIAAVEFYIDSDAMLAALGS